MKNPVTYSDWIILFDRFGNGDDAVLQEMNSGSFDLDAGTALRFYTKAEEAYKTRKKLWLKRFQRSFETQNIKSADDFGMVLLTGKKNLSSLSGLAKAKGLPEDLKIALKKDLEAFVTEIKESLKKNLPKGGIDKEKMLLSISSFRLPENIEKNSGNLNDGQEKNITAHRKIIF